MSNFYGDNTRWFIGVVEDNMNDPQKLGRVRVRAFGVHSPFITDIPTDDLPWATVMVAATEGGISGVGRSPTGIEQGAWVFGFFLDGKASQNPIIVGTMPKIELPEENINPLSTAPNALHGDVVLNGGLRGNSNAEKTFNAFMDEGYSDTVASAVVGTLAVQSNIGLDPSKEVSAGDNFGIGRWRGERLKEYFEYASINNSDPNAVDTQIAYVTHELKTKPELNSGALSNSKSIDEAVEVFTKEYLKIADTEENKKARQSFSYDAFERFGQ
jgi:hypothetical protein